MSFQSAYSWITSAFLFSHVSCICWSFLCTVLLMLLYAAWMQVMEKGSVKMVFLFKQFSNVSIIFIAPIPVLVNSSAFHFCASEIDGVSKACPVCLYIIWAKAWRFKLTVHFSCECLLDSDALEPGNIQSLRSIYALWPAGKHSSKFLHMLSTYNTFRAIN